MFERSWSAVQIDDEYGVKKQSILIKRTFRQPEQTRQQNMRADIEMRL